MMECYNVSLLNYTMCSNNITRKHCMISKDPNPPAPDGPGSIPSTQPQRVHQMPDTLSPRRPALQAGSVPDFQPPSLGEQDRLRRCWSPQTRRSWERNKSALVPIRDDQLLKALSGSGCSGSGRCDSCRPPSADRDPVSSSFSSSSASSPPTAEILQSCLSVLCSPYSVCLCLKIPIHSFRIKAYCKQTPR